MQCEKLYRASERENALLLAAISWSPAQKKRRRRVCLCGTGRIYCSRARTCVLGTDRGQSWPEASRPALPIALLRFRRNVQHCNNIVTACDAHLRLACASSQVFRFALWASDVQGRYSQKWSSLQPENNWLDSQIFCLRHQLSVKPNCPQRRFKLQ